MFHVNTESTAKKLKDVCRTHWIQRVDSYVVFLELLPAIHLTLQAMTCPNQYESLGTDWNWDGETVTKANGFLYQFQSSTFLVCFKILFEILSCLQGLTVKLQMQAIDVLYAYTEASSIISVLQNMRENSEKEFKLIFDSTLKLGRDLHGNDFELCQPRINRSQLHRMNVQVATSEEYYRITLYNEFLSHVISELNVRFVDNPPHGIGLLHLLPSQLCACSTSTNNFEVPENLKCTVDFYKDDLPHNVMYPIEYRMWVRKWSTISSEALPSKLVDAFKACDPTTFPNVHILLQHALTLPITSCESERSFSQLKLIKTSCRSTMIASRLSSLALMKINRSRCETLNMCKLVQLFQQQHPRRMKLPFILAD